MWCCCDVHWIIYFDKKEINVIQDYCSLPSNHRHRKLWSPWRWKVTFIRCVHSYPNFNRSNPSRFQSIKQYCERFAKICIKIKNLLEELSLSLYNKGLVNKKKILTYREGFSNKFLIRKFKYKN